MENICGSISDMSRTPSSGTEACSSAFEHSSSEADGFSVYSGEDINVIFSDPFGDDGVEVPKYLSGPSANMDMHQQRSSSGSRRSSSSSSTSSILEDDVEAGYEADSDTHTTPCRTPVRRSRAKSRPASVHYLVERVEPTIEVLAPLTPEELAHLKEHTNIPIPAHYEPLLPRNAGEASAIPSSASSSTSEIPLDRRGCVVERTQPVTTLLPQHFVAELEQPQPDLGHGSDNMDELHRPRVQPVNLADNGDFVQAAAAPSALTFGLGVAPPASPEHLTTIGLNNHLHALHLQDLPPTPDLRPWLAVASGEPSPMVLASPAAPLVVHAPRPRLARMASRR